MGPKKREPKAKPRVDKIARIVKELSDPGATRVERVRNVAEALELEHVVNILESTEEVAETLRTLLRPEGVRYTLKEAAEKAGLTEEQFARLNLASGFANPDPNDKIFTDEDVETLQMFQLAIAFFGEDLALQMVRVMGSAMARVADTFISGFAVAVGNASREGEFGADEMIQANETATGMLPGAMRAMDVLLRRHIDYRSRGGLLLGEEWEGVDAVDRAIGFCDLVGYTSLSQQISTEELGRVLRTFENTSSDLITSKGGSVVKLIGDEVMFVAPTATLAAEIGVGLAQTFDEMKDMPPVRVGIASGRVVASEGDYHGPIVNLAARVVKLAPPGGVLAPADAMDMIHGFESEDYGPQRLKGFEGAINVVRLHRS